MYKQLGGGDGKHEGFVEKAYNRERRKESAHQASRREDRQADQEVGKEVNLIVTEDSDSEEEEKASIHS